ncbi:MAG TPA: hypothetical protein VII43_04825 [Opitutaceae bacterium]
MTDTNPSGASFAPVADSSAPVAGAVTPAGNFGSTRGSGLARGKRQTSASAPAASPVKTDYKPTALEIITPQREYTNPFASQQPAAPPAEAPVEAKAPEAPAAVSEPEQAAAPEAPVAEEKSEIQILPPAESIRPAVSWESPSASEGMREIHSGERPHHDDRPTFRPDRREDQNGGAQPEGQRPRFEGRDPRRDFQRQPRDPRDARQPRDPRDARQPRDPREARQPRDPRDERQPRDPRDERPRYSQGPSGHASEAAKPASGGFFGWLKGLFGGQKPAEAPAPRESAREPFGDGQRPRRRHRGGRGHGGQNQGFRGDRPEFGGDRPQGERNEHGGEHGGEHQGGHRRRRHRGGPGRDRGGEPRSEGHQGGGAI